MWSCATTAHVQRAASPLGVMRHYGTHAPRRAAPLYAPPMLRRSEALQVNAHRFCAVSDAVNYASYTSARIPFYSYYTPNVSEKQEISEKISYKIVFTKSRVFVHYTAWQDTASSMSLHHALRLSLYHPPVGKSHACADAAQSAPCRAAQQRPAGPFF